jgi:uncharacterized protein (TIGR02284 family)
MSMPQEASLAVLQRLIDNSLAGERGFRATAQHAKSDDLRALLKRRAEECRVAVQELQAHASRLDSRWVDCTSRASNEKSAWLQADADLSAWSDLTLIEACERGEDTLLDGYAQASTEALEPSIKQVLEMQRLSTRRSHDQIRAMRDRLRSLVPAY